MSSTSVDFSSKIDFPTSWYEPTPEELEEEARMLRSARQLPEPNEAASSAAGTESQSLAGEADEMSILYKAASGGRQIEIDILGYGDSFCVFLLYRASLPRSPGERSWCVVPCSLSTDSANVTKFEKLVQNDLIKSPFKRRLSGGSSSEETDDRRAVSVMDRDVDGDGEAAGGSPSSGTRAACGTGGQWKKSKKHENDHGSSLRSRRESSSSGASSQNSRRQIEYETDEAVLARRQKQIDYGKNTLGYETYIQQVPRHARTKEHPATPQKHLKYSRRAWDGLIKVWRKKLHCFDPNGDSSTFDENA
ncbi:AGAP012972-PA [Anopheles gambiae str. PEST]|uniref:AGAP012972-PA n=1 Tax=Anopheles gambiae TaxID=7165 RepID=F5HL36_ANOGA|nr:AGAP012972-PA [Anopheles gambiae str. PEST]